MGSSNMGVVTTGDVEDQRHNPNWFVEHKYMLRPNQEGEVYELGFFIWKVPEDRRQPPSAFSPRAWRFGLHNRENMDSSGSEAVKLGYAVQYGLVGEKWDHFCNAIVDDPKAMLTCYGLQSGVTCWTDEQIRHVLALDALMLATYIDVGCPENERRLWLPSMLPSRFHNEHVFKEKCDMWESLLQFDLFLVENQIPLVLIDKVVEYVRNIVASRTSEGDQRSSVDVHCQQRSVDYVVREVTDCFMTTSGEAFKIDNSSPLDGEKIHILGAAYKVICGSKAIVMNSAVCRDEYIQVSSATKLKQSGIKIVGVDGPLCTMSYTKTCLSLPKMKIYDETFSFIRNMAWYEDQTISKGCMFHDYILLMTDLIQAPEDLDLLIEYGVIYNSCGSKGFEMWVALNEGLEEISSFQAHHDMKKDICTRCTRRRYRLWSEFKMVFCSKPWLVLSTIAVVLVTMATLVQTYISIIGSNKMKPKFL